jgi:hypothetical protein
MAVRRQILVPSHVRCDIPHDVHAYSDWLPEARILRKCEPAHIHLFDLKLIFETGNERPALKRRKSRKRKILLQTGSATARRILA